MTDINIEITGKVEIDKDCVFLVTHEGTEYNLVDAPDDLVDGETATIWGYRIARIVNPCGRGIDFRVTGRVDRS